MFTRFYGSGFSVAISRLMLLTFVAVLPLMGGCGEDDNPIVDDDHDHDHDAPIHADVDGFFLEVDGKDVYRQFQGTHSGGLTVGVGQEIEVHAVFLDANGAEAHLHEVEAVDEHGHEEEFGLGLTDYDSAIIAIHLDHDEHDHDEHDHGEDDHDEEEHGEEEHEDEHGHEEHSEDELPFGLEGLKVGTTTIKLQLLHGDHPDFTAALLIPVTVE
ncbi:MAG: hypothetical protein OXU36_21255 [Candidatus Poribacteria bacterium]|nr:hypothetical protein [Candidatus Poribacteria bacterium]